MVEEVQIPNDIFKGLSKTYLKLKQLTSEILLDILEKEDPDLIKLICQKVSKFWDSTSIRLLRYWIENSSFKKIYSDMVWINKYQIIGFLILLNKNNKEISMLINFFIGVCSNCE